MTKILFSAVICLVLSSCAMSPPSAKKINGVSFVGTRDTLHTTHIVPLKSIHVNYTALMPFGFIRDQSNPEIIFNTERQWFGEKVTGVRQYVEMLRNNNIEIMLKPQIWIRRGEFTGHLTMSTEAAWQQLEDSYETFILEYAQLAEELNIKLFCIGTELEQFILNRPNYWKDLITKIKQVYKGQLTYAANWDEYQKTPFWQELDYIGVNGYFPLTAEQTPGVDSCKQALHKWKIEMEAFSQLHAKPVVFTEFGYRSVDFGARQPWRSDRDMTAVNLEAQTNATVAFFETFWNEDWVSGGFIWKWFPNHANSGGLDDSRFTPQNKPAEAVIKEQYKHFR